MKCQGKNPDAELGVLEVGMRWAGIASLNLFHLIFKTRRINAQHLASSISGELRGTS